MQKKLGPEGLRDLWQKVFELMKSITGEVDIKNKGTLQKQILNMGTAATNDNTVDFTSADETDPAGWTEVAKLTSGEKHSLIVQKISTMCKNVRWLYKVLGNTDISTTGDGTVTALVTAMYSGKLDKAAIVQNAATAATDKVSSAAVTKDLQDQLSKLNTDMISKITLTGAGGADPVTVLQDNWSSLPSGSYPIYISVGAAYGAIVMNASGDYGAAIIFNYSGIFAIVEKYQQEWSVSDITTHNDLRAENGAISWASSDFTHPGTNALYKNRYAATLTLTLQSSSTVTTWQDVAILPVKPMQTIYVGNATDYEKVNIQITSGGVVQARNMSGNSNYYTGSITFLI